MINKSVVNADGQLVELWIIEKPDGSFHRYNLPEGCSTVTYVNDALTVTNGILHAPLKPRWAFETGAWVDDATVEELAAAYPAVELAATVEDTTLDLLVDHEYRLCMLELGIL